MNRIITIGVDISSKLVHVHILCKNEVFCSWVINLDSPVFILGACDKVILIWNRISMQIIHLWGYLFACPNFFQRGQIKLIMLDSIVFREKTMVKDINDILVSIKATILVMIIAKIVEKGWRVGSNIIKLVKWVCHHNTWALGVFTKLLTINFIINNGYESTRTVNYFWAIVAKNIHFRLSFVHPFQFTILANWIKDFGAALPKRSTGSSWSEAEHLIISIWCRKTLVAEPYNTTICK